MKACKPITTKYTKGSPTTVNYSLGKNYPGKTKPKVGKR